MNRIINWNPRQTGTIFDEIDRLLSSQFCELGYQEGDAGNSTAGSNRATSNFYEDDAGFYITIELPGVKKEDIELSLNEGKLTLSASGEIGAGDSQKKLTYSRVVSVPEGIDADKLSAEFKDGVLTTRLPKQEARKPKTIQVE